MEIFITAYFLYLTLRYELINRILQNINYIYSYQLRRLLI